MRTLLEQYFDRNEGRFLAEWSELVSFASISADPAHDADCMACAEWLVNHLNGIGFESSLLAAVGKPVVHALRKGNPDRPVILFYGHYDVQPSDPLEEWFSPPFELTARDGRFYGRGAQDNKGQLLYVLKAIEALLAGERDLPTIKIILEGEEESGGNALSSLLPTLKERIRSDILMVCDTDTAPSGAPAIMMGLRGIIGLSIRLSGPRHDLHSGLHGGLAPNPAQGMAALVASLHNPDGSVAVEGFYDGLRHPTGKEKQLMSLAPIDTAAYQSEVGVAPLGGEHSRSPEERIGFRPSLDVNGIHSGYGGAGMKTVIAATATAKLTARLVPGQDPAQCLAALEDHCRARVPPGLTLSIDESSSAGGGFRLDADSPLTARARAVLDELGDQPAALLWSGASIPIVAALGEAAGAEPLLVGFGSEQDCIHAPNESFSLAQFRMGYLYAGLMIASLQPAVGINQGRTDGRNHGHS